MEDVLGNSLSQNQPERYKADLEQAIILLKSDIRRQTEVIKAAYSEQRRALAAKQIAQKDLHLALKIALEDQVSFLLASEGSSKASGEINSLKMQIKRIEKNLTGVRADRAGELKGKDLDAIFMSCNRTYTESTMKFNEEQKKLSLLQSDLGKVQMQLKQYEA